ncbi:MAG: hypothetical protein AAB590_00240 [Patescibacteria group bacterium]
MLVAVASGHAANSQLGPVRPTAELSGQSFASCVHAVVPSGAFATRTFITQSAMPIVSMAAPVITAYSLMPKAYQVIF